MSTSWYDIAMDRHAADLQREEELEASRLRDRTHESAQHVLDGLIAWLEATGARVIRTHPQEVWAGKTPIGPSVRIAVQAARTPVESTVAGLVARARRRPEWAGVPMAVALPDLPRLRTACERASQDAPHVRVTWLFVGRGGSVAVVPPPRDDPEAAEPASAVG